MALPTTRAFRSILSDRLPFRRLFTVLVLARLALLVLSGKVSPDVAGRNHEPDGLPAPQTTLPSQESGGTMRTAGDTLVVAGLIGLLGVAGATTLVAPGTTHSVRLAGTAPDVAEPRSVLPEIARVVREAAQEAATTAKAVTPRYAAARSRALGPTTPLWHAVALDRLAGVRGEVCETTVCGSLVRVSTERIWPVVARDVCPACTTVAH